MSQLNSSLYSQKLNNGYFKIMKLKIQLGDTGDRTRGLSHAKRTRYHCAISPPWKFSHLLGTLTYSFFFRTACTEGHWCHHRSMQRTLSDACMYLSPQSISTKLIFADEMAVGFLQCVQSKNFQRGSTQHYI